MKHVFEIWFIFQIYKLGISPDWGPFGRDEAYIHESCCLVVGFIKRPFVFLIWADKKLSRQKVKQVVLRHAFRLVPV